MVSVTCFSTALDAICNELNLNDPEGAKVLTTAVVDWLWDYAYENPATYGPNLSGLCAIGSWEIAKRLPTAIVRASNFHAFVKWGDYIIDPTAVQYSKAYAPYIFDLEDVVKARAYYWNHNVEIDPQDRNQALSFFEDWWYEQRPFI